ncbi:hypothetical protein IKD98_00795 [Candidatus Saccharibacteria bacterium]|nr:hypothetical protein [Candidatus Saccharibacteria bacterium]
MKQYTTLTIGIPITAMILSGVVLASSYVSAETDVVDEINITVPESCSLSGTGMNSHNANIANGTYRADIGTTTLHAFCNDSEGFAIYAAGYTGDTIGETNSNKLVGASTNTTIETGLATSAGNPDVSNWAMKLAITQDSGDTTGTNAYTIDSAPNTSGGSDASFGEYHVVPHEYTKVAHKNSATDMTANTGGVKLTTTYAAYISKTQPADTYTGQVIYALVHPSDAPAPQVSSCQTKVPGVTYMQEFATMTAAEKATILGNMTEDAQYSLKDSRDNKSYCVAKLRDGNIWMTQNLDHDIVNTQNYYTNQNTDIGYNTSTSEYDTATWTAPSATLTDANKNNWVGSTTIPMSYDPGDLYWNGTKSDNSDWRTYNRSCTWNSTTQKYENCDESLNPIATYTDTTGESQYHLGNYYNWTAAVAMSDSSSHTTSGELIEQSICPAGWTLPRVGTGNDTFYGLWNEYGFTSSSYIDTNSNNQHDEGEDALWTTPLYSAAGGYFNGVLRGVGRNGDFWLPVVALFDEVRGAYFETGGYVLPSSNVDRRGGSTIRCVARPVASSVSGL